MGSLVSVSFNDEVFQFNSDGYINATEVAKKYGKDVHEFLRLPSTVDYIKALENREKSKTGKIPELTITKRGRYGGTWLHPKLAVFFARWISPEFAVWCDDQIDMIIHGQVEQVDWKTIRHAAAATNKAQNVALKLMREIDGKDTPVYIYSNDAKMINWCVTGEFGSIDRNSASKEVLDLLAKLETHNIAYIGTRIDYNDRKKMLKEIADREKAKWVKELN